MSAWIADTLVSTTFLMLLVLAARRPMARAFGARAGYALWALPALRMILPPLPGLHPLLGFESGAPLAIGIVPPGVGADRIVLPPDVPLAFQAPPPAPGLDWSTVLVSVWAAGALLWFGWQMLRYRHFVTSAIAASYRLGRECGVDVLVSARVSGPVASGIVRRRIFLPADFASRYTSAERRQALLHEGAHHDRHDLLANLVGLAVLALHWWNPIAHRAYRAFRADQELACDATVLAAADAEERYAYGSALVKSSGGRTPAAACALDRTAEIKRRLAMIKRGRLAGLRRGGGAALALVAIAAGLFATASGHAAVERFRPIAPVPAIAPIAPPEVAGPVAPVRPVAPNPPAPPPVLFSDEEAAEAREAGMHAAEAGRREARDGAAAAAMARRSIEATRVAMAERCAARGHPVVAGERDWSRLALCDGAAIRADVRRALLEARAELDRDPGYGARATAEAKAALDRAAAEVVRPDR